MRRIGRRTTIVLATVALSAILTAEVVAATRPTDSSLPSARKGHGAADPVARVFK